MALRHAAPGEKISLPALFSSLAPGVKTTALVKTERFEAIHLVLRSGTNIPEHAVAGYLTLQCLEGSATLETDGRSIELEAGDWIYLERNERHGLSAARDCSLILTILFD
jgi:quercetin dioxygenase-like cupin family protein